MTLAELIDLELQLHRDQSASAETLWERDARIAEDVGASELDDPALVREWLRWARGPGPATGDGIVHALRSVARLGGMLGFFLGALGVAGWLAMSDRLPVNVINFWPLIVGLPLLSLLVWLGVTALGNSAGMGWVRVASRNLTRWSPESGRLRDDWRALQRVEDRLGRLPFWAASRIGHGCTVAFQFGALAALVVLPVIDDPAFGWRSRLLDEHQVERAASLIATPWNM
jgi:hypothetical protein